MQRNIVNTDPMPVMQVHSNHVEMLCTFSTGGTVVNVTSPAFEIRQTNASGATVSVPAGSLLVPFSKQGGTVGRYHVCFLAGGWLPDGDYYIGMSGTCSGSVVSQTGSFSARSASTIQGYIELVRSSLRDYDGQLYYIEDTGSTLWNDGDIYDALTRSLQKINMTPPYRYTFEMDTVPWPGLLVEGAVIYALHSRGILEVANDIAYNDELSFSISRSSKYVSMLQVFANSYEQSLLRIKKDYGFARAMPIGAGMTRYPASFSRIFSFIPRVTNYGLTNFVGY